MAKTESWTVNLTKLIETTPDKAILALDIEGAPKGVNQISCVNSKGKQTVNQYGDKPNHFTVGSLSEDQRIIIKNVLKKTQILIGYNISSDITALAKQGIDISLNIVIVDLFLTVQHMVETGVIEKCRLANMTLKGVAEYYGIKDVSGYHDSRVDAKITMRLFHTMYKAYHGQFWAMMNRKQMAIAKGKAEPIEITNEEEETMNNAIIDWMQDYSTEPDCDILKSDQGFYQALVPIKGTKQIVRMSQKELDMYLAIRKMAPNYPLRVFYLTILAPGIISAVKNNEEATNSAKEDTDGHEINSDDSYAAGQSDIDMMSMFEDEMAKQDTEGNTAQKYFENTSSEALESAFIPEK